MENEDLLAEIKNLRFSFDEAKKSNDVLISKFDQRLEEMEHVVIGHEASGKIGISERVRRLEDNWGKVTFGASAITLLILESGKSLFAYLLGFK